MATSNKDFRTSGALKILLPGIVLQSVLMGGGYATGREIIEYGGKFGAYGWVSGVFTFFTFAVIAVLTFELARIYRIYDYKSILKQIIGKAWPIYDILYVILLFLIISIMASATGEILQQTIGLNYMVGVVILILIVAFLNFFGSAFIAKFETYGTIALYAAYIIFTIMVITANKDNIATVMATQDTSYVENATLPMAMVTGIIYASYNLSAIPAGLFTLRAQTKRSESIISGIIGALLMTIPWFLTYFAVMGYYPDDSIIGASVLVGNAPICFRQQYPRFGIRCCSWLDIDRNSYWHDPCFIGTSGSQPGRKKSGTAFSQETRYHYSSDSGCSDFLL
ncbi:MAG: hypothetical protein V8Q36_06745 [Anaerotignum sp.]